MGSERTWLWSRPQTKSPFSEYPESWWLAWRNEQSPQIHRAFRWGAWLLRCRSTSCKAPFRDEGCTLPWGYWDVPLTHASCWWDQCAERRGGKLGAELLRLQGWCTIWNVTCRTIVSVTHQTELSAIAWTCSCGTHQSTGKSKARVRVWATLRVEDGFHESFVVAIGPDPQIRSIRKPTERSRVSHPHLLRCFPTKPARSERLNSSSNLI